MLLLAFSTGCASAASNHGHGSAGSNSNTVLNGLSCSTASITGAGTDACRVTLSGPAPKGGLSVALSSSSATVSVPATVTIPTNASSVAFTATAGSTQVAQTVNLIAAAGGVSNSFALQLNAATPTLSLSSSSIAFGDVVVNTAAKYSVTLSSTGTSPVTINGATVSGAGFSFSGAALPVTLNPGQSTAMTVQFSPTVAGAQSGQLAITSTSSTNPTAVIALGGNGTSSTSHQVALSWNAPTDSSDPITGYNVYRTASGGSNYQLLNSSPVGALAYTDATVLSGSSYDYIVTSVDAEGAESVPSNTITEAIP